MDTQLPRNPTDGQATGVGLLYRLPQGHLARGWLPMHRSCMLARSAGTVRFGVVDAARFESCQRVVMVARAIGATVVAGRMLRVGLRARMRLGRGGASWVGIRRPLYSTSSRPSGRSSTSTRTPA